MGDVDCRSGFVFLQSRHHTLDIKWSSSQTVRANMGTIYRITDRVWGISDLPWPFFYALQGFVILKLIVGTIILCLVTLTYPFLYAFGVWYLVKKKKKPDWLRFALYTGLMGWYIFCIIKFLVLGYPMHRYSGWPGGDKPAATAVRPEQQKSENIIWSDGSAVPADERHTDDMQKYKNSTTDPFGDVKKVPVSRNEADEYNDRLEEYLDDPEDEIEFSPEIFDFNDD